MEHTKHIWRAVLLLIAGSVAAIGARHFLIPKSFGERGFYRYDSIAEYMAKPAVHGDRGSCNACHQPPAETLAKGKHASLSCEVCHGPLTAHVSENAKIADATVTRANSLCLGCHQKLRARPEKFPQIEASEHLVANGVIAAGEPVPDEACIACHDVHSPGTP